MSQMSDDMGLDVFYYQMVKPKYCQLWSVVSKLLLLYHGQAGIERGFSINKQVSDVNQTEDSLVARRRVKDHLLSVGGLDKVIITNDMVAHVGQARHRYENHLEEKRKTAVKERKAQKRRAIEEEYDELLKKKKVLEMQKDSLESGSSKALDRAEAVTDFNMLAKGNSLRRSAKDKIVEIDQVCTLIQTKKQELESML